MIKRFLPLIAALLIIGAITGCAARPANSFTDTLPLSAQKTTVDGAAGVLGFPIPVPSYLPGNYSIQDIYVQQELKSVNLLISDNRIEKNVVTQKNNSGIRQYEFRCQMAIGIRWGSKGIPGGLKLPGERPTVVPPEGTSVASVLVVGDTQNTLWWDWRPNSDLAEMYEIAISANKLISSEDLIKTAESMKVITTQNGRILTQSLLPENSSTPAPSSGAAGE